MIVIKLMGGLGNQMFQYAFAKHLALKNKTDLKLDLHFLLDRSPREDFVFRDFDLDIFNIQSMDLVNDYELDLFNERLYKSWIKRIIKKIVKREICHLSETNFYYDKSYFLRSKYIYVEGYFQTEKYFKKIEKILREEFTFKHSLSKFEVELKNKIVASNSVCINFRRTDFVDLKSSKDTHGFVGMEYYFQAIEIVVSKIENPHFYVFSDDIEWCENNFKIDFPVTFVSHDYKGNKFSSYLQLMTKCKHFIIPNSTFAWWAAWLSKGTDKIVIAPKRWFKNEELQQQTFDLYPSDWILL